MSRARRKHTHCRAGRAKRVFQPGSSRQSFPGHGRVPYIDPDLLSQIRLAPPGKSVMIDVDIRPRLSPPRVIADGTDLSFALMARLERDFTLHRQALYVIDRNGAEQHWDLSADPDTPLVYQIEALFDELESLGIRAAVVVEPLSHNGVLASADGHSRYGLFVWNTDRNGSELFAADITHIEREDRKPTRMMSLWERPDEVIASFADCGETPDILVPLNCLIGTSTIDDRRFPTPHTYRAWLASDRSVDLATFAAS